MPEIFRFVNTLPLAWSMLSWALVFFARYYVLIGGLSLIAGVGRLLQIVKHGELHPMAFMGLEVLVLGIRLLMLLAIARIAKVDRETVREFFARGASRWMVPVAGIVLFILFAMVFNRLVFLLVNWLIGNEDVVQAMARLSPRALNMVILRTALSLFIKNLTIIPFMLVWMTGVVKHVAQMK